MKSYQKHIRFQNIELHVQQDHPKDISRVHFQLIEPNIQIHKTIKYGIVTPNTIKWQSPIQFMYSAQSSFKFQTICEHQYGYQIQELKALYSGQILIKPEDFFIVNHFPLLNKKGQKAGTVSFIIKVIDRQIGLKYNEQDQVQNQQRIKPDLIARITFIQASLIINPLYFKDFQGKKSISSKSHLSVQFDGIQITAKQKQNKRWVFKGQNKVQLLQKSHDRLKVKLQNNQEVILSGELLIQSLLKNKRFVTQPITMLNPKSIKIGTLNLQLRAIQKKQILDLMYSPQKLQNVMMQRTQFETELSRIKQNLQSRTNFSQPAINMKKKLSLDLKLKKKDQSLFLKHSRMESPQNISSSRISKNQRYNAYFRSRYQDIKFSQSKRFEDKKANSPYISYTGQEYGSDFLSKDKKKGPNFSKTQRTDFTKPFKNHPGIGDYRLPSIWQRS